jgi:energy-coupling factor transporter ATP-binding protein EcfA2
MAGTRFNTQLSIQKLIFLLCFISTNSICTACTALDHGSKSTGMKGLRQQWGNLTLDENTLVAFPVSRGGCIEELNIADEIWTNRSEQFGMKLLGIDRLDKIDEIVHNNRETANIRIISQWFHGKGVSPITCGTLVNVLYGIGFNELANEIGSTCEILKIMDENYKPARLKKYSRLLSEGYKEDTVIDSTLWLPKRLHGQNITFVDLILKEEGRDILQADLFGDLRSGTRILLLGRPGVGKTTITRHLAKYLVDTEHFYLIIKIHLGVAHRIGDLNTLLRATTSEYFDPDDIGLISEYVSRTLGDGICFLLDGLDEYDGSDFIASLVGGNTLSKSAVIVTSRPSAAKDIEHLFHRVVEIIGFEEEGIKMYLKQLKLPEDKYKTIYQYLYSHPDIMQLCYLPLHLSMLVYVAVATPDSHTLSLADTETELYTDFLSLTIKQYESVRHGQTVESLEECLENVHREIDLCVLLQNISRNAFEGIIGGYQTFNSSSFGKLPDTVNITAKIEALSLFKVEKEYGRRGEELFVYHYSHSTFQDFLAAFHLAILPREEQLQYNWLYGACKFFLGLIGSELNQEYSDEVVSQIFVSYASHLPARDVHTMKFAYEVGRTSLFIALLRDVGFINNSNTMHVNAKAYDSHDCWYVGYALTLSPLHEVVVEDGSEQALCISSITEYLKLNPRIVRVTKLVLGYDHGPWSILSRREDPIITEEILRILPYFQKELTSLELRFSKLEHASSVLHLGETLRVFRKLKSLALFVSISVIENGHLESVLGGLTYLEHLDLDAVDRLKGDTALPDGLLEFKCLQKLKSLKLWIGWDKEYVDVNTTALIGGLQHLTGVQSLSINLGIFGGFRENGATELLNGLKRVSSSDVELLLDLCSFHGMGNVSAENLAAALRNLTMLTNFSMCINFHYDDVDGNSAVIQISEGLKGLNELQALRLILRWRVYADECNDGAAIALVNGLKHLSSLSVLELKLKQSGSCSKVSLLFEHLTQLRELSFSIVGESNDVTKLLNGLHHLKQLRKLDLSWGDIGDENMGALIEALRHMKYLQTLILSYNDIGDAGLQQLATALSESRFLRHLQVLLLDYNEFTRIGARIGAQILSLNLVKLLKLHTLDLDVLHHKYSAQAIVKIYQIKKSASSRNRSLNETCDSFHAGNSALWGGFLSGISVLLGGLLCYFACRSLLNQSMSRNIRGLPLKGPTVYDNLAQNTFSASFAWNLETLHNCRVFGSNQRLNGSGTIIAILDTAIDPDCPAFLQKSTIINKLPRVPVVSIEHGSVCASVAVGSSYQISPTTVVPSGVAPGAQLIMYRVAEGKYCCDEAILAALDDIKEKIKGGIQVDVVSISYNLKEDNAEEIHEKIRALTRMHVVFVAAGGNRGKYQSHAPIPACFEDCVISVGALDKDGYESRFTSWGRIDVSAPGENIPTPLSSSKCEGTSFATPAIGGLVLLLKQCAKACGLPASEGIHDVHILRNIFTNHMTTLSRGEKLLDPGKFFKLVLSNSNLLNEIVREHLAMDTT